MLNLATQSFLDIKLMTDPAATSIGGLITIVATFSPRAFSDKVLTRNLTINENRHNGFVGAFSIHSYHAQSHPCNPPPTHHRITVV